MNEFTDEEVAQIDAFVEQLDNEPIERIVCANKHHPETCGEECDIVVSRASVDQHGWTAIVVAYNWNVVMHRCLDPDHPVHVLGFCSLACVRQWADDQLTFPHLEATPEQDEALRKRILDLGT